MDTSATYILIWLYMTLLTDNDVNAVDNEVHDYVDDVVASKSFILDDVVASKVYARLWQTEGD